jgi:hypothetical protein
MVEGLESVKQTIVLGVMVRLQLFSVVSCLVTAPLIVSPPLEMSEADPGPVYDPNAPVFTVIVADPVWSAAIEN